MITVEIGKDEYIEFIRVLTAIKDYCSDLNIIDGVIRQRIDTRQAIIQFDLKHILGDNVSIPIASLKLKLDMLKTFLNEDVTLILEDDKYSFNDAVSKYSFRIPNARIMNEHNRFMSTEELDALITGYDEQVLQISMDKKVTDRIKSIVQIFGIQDIFVGFKETKARIYAEHQNKEQLAEFVKDIQTPLQNEAYIGMISTPLIFDHDGIMDLSIGLLRVRDRVQSLQENVFKINNTDCVVYSSSVLKFEEE